MRILVLSNAFEHPQYNTRLRQQCDYLVSKGHQIDVYTEPWDPLEFKHSYEIHEIGELNYNPIKWLLLTMHSFFTNYKERKFAYQTLWYIRKQHYDLLLCHTNSCFPLCAAAMIAKIRHLKMHVDLSDVMELSPNYQTVSWWHPWKALKQHLYIYRRNQALLTADSISTTSPQHVEFLQHLHPHVSLMYNCFDPEQCYYQPVPTKLFRINYVGYSYRSQDMDMVLHIINQFKNELPKMQWTFYTNDIKYDHIKYSRPNLCGMLPSEIVGDVLRQSSLILMVNDTEDNSLQSEQFYQSIGVEKPILFLGASKGSIPDLITFTHAGLASNSVKESMDFIRQLYHQWEQDGYTHQEISNKELFDMHHMGQQLEQHLLSLLTPNQSPA